MPRKKTIEKPPLDTITIEGTVFEVRDRTCPEVGKGSGQRNQLSAQFNEALVWLFETHIFPHHTDGELINTPDCLKSASRLDAALALAGISDRYGMTTYSIRRRLYPMLKEEIRILNSALKKKQRNI